MKRLCMISILLLLSLSLLACTAQQTTYTITKNGIEFQVDRAEQTISDGDNIYSYTFSGDSSNFEVTITYPNGSSYWLSQSGGMGLSGWSSDYVEDAYVSGETLVDIVRETAPKKAMPGKIIAGMILIALGLFDMAVPKVSWYLGYGWHYKRAEPSDAALLFARIGGGIAVVIGIVLLLM